MALKIKNEHYEHIKKHFLALAENPHKPIDEARQAIIAHGRCTDIDMALRWNILRYCLGSRWICDHLYPYMNDTHIDSALKKIMTEI